MKILNIIALTAVSAATVFSASAAVVMIDLTNASTTAVPVSTGDLLDVGAVLTELPLTVSVLEDLTNTLSLTVASGSSFDPENTTVNGAGGSFGVNSPTPSVGSENASRFDVDAAEQLTFTFSQDVYLVSVDFTSLSGDEAFTVASVTGINDENTNVNDVYDFTDNGMTSGLFFAAGDSILFEATGPAGSSVGLQGLTIETVPEPTSSLFLSASCFALLLRRRR